MSGLPDDIPIMLQWWGSVIASAAKIRVSGLTVTDLPPYLAAIGVTGNSRFFGNNGFGNAGFWEIPEFLVFIYLSCHMSMGQFKSDHFSVSGLEKKWEIRKNALFLILSELQMECFQDSEKIISQVWIFVLLTKITEAIKSTKQNTTCSNGLLLMTKCILWLLQFTRPGHEVCDDHNLGKRNSECPRNKTNI